MRLMRTLEKKFENFGGLLSFLEGAADHKRKHKITRIWAVSAYYDIESIKQLIDHIKSRISKKPELLIVIGTINSGELAELKKIQKMEFGNKFDGRSGIRVTKRRGLLFHSKGYLVETNRNAMCAIGSMNLTQNGLKKNEEILTYSRDRAFVRSFEKYIENLRSKGSKEIGAISEKEPGIRWMPKGWNESAQGNDYNGWFPPEFPVIADGHGPGPAVRQYFKKLGLPELNDSNLINEKEFTLALYKLLFEECGKNSDKCKREGVTLRYCDALWRRGFGDYHKTLNSEVGKKLTCSARFNVTLKGEELACYIFVYLLRDKSGIRLGVCVGKKDNVVLQLDVSKHWKKIGDDKGQYWEVYHDGLMAGNVAMGRGVECEKALSAVRKAGRAHWIKKPSWSKKKLVCLDKLYVAEEVTWENSRVFLARLLHYAIIRADIKKRRD